MTLLRVGSLCTGYGGLDTAVMSVFGGELVWWADVEPGPIAVMDRHRPGVPNIGDIKTVPWTIVPHVDILTAGYPCQPFSNAGKRKGADDPRHLWPWIAQGIGALRPHLVVLENVDAHLRRGFDVVLADLADLGYDATWTIVRASDVGAPHRRARLFVLAVDASSHTARGLFHRCGDIRQSRRPEHTDGNRPPADTQHRTEPEWTRHSRREVIERSPERERPSGRSTQYWGDYAGAIARWEGVLGRAAPDPTTTGQRGARVLSPAFAEWMMGLPEGHVTGTSGLSRSQMLTLLGNGVVPQQAEFAIRTLLPLLMINN